MKAIFLHIYYRHLWAEIRDRLKKITFEFNLYVNLVEGHCDNLKISKDFPNAIINSWANQGMDIGGQLRTFNYWREHGANEEFLIFLHSKGKSAYLKDKAKVRETDELRNLLWSIVAPNKIPLAQEAFTDENVGMVGVKEWHRYPGLAHGEPIDVCDYYCERLNLNNFKNNSFGFIGGTMFWVRSKIYRKVLADIDIIKLVSELPSSSNGGNIHALERILGYMVLSEGYKIKGI